MGFSELINLLKQQNESDKGFLIHLNTDDLDEKSCRNTGIEFADLYTGGASLYVPRKQLPERK